MFIERGEKYQIYHVQFAKGVVGLNADVVRAEVSLYFYIYRVYIYHNELTLMISY